jgi:YD repeat-containing protein
MTDHTTALTPITNATTTHELAAALETFTDLRTDDDPGRAPGVPYAAPDGKYFNGYDLFTKSDGHVAATRIHDLPRHTISLWTQLNNEQREQREDEQLIAEVTEQRRRGRPSIGRPVSVRLPAWRIRTLDRDAEAASVERADLMRALISYAYQNIRRDAETAGVDEATIIRGLLSKSTDITD